MDQAVNRYFAKHLNLSRSNHRASSSQALRKLVLGFSDQQLVTGIGILIVSLARFWGSYPISIYHFVLVTDMAWFVSNTHLITLTVLSEYLKENPILRTWRLLAIVAMGGLLWGCTWLSCNEFWAGAFNCPAKCLATNVEFGPLNFDPVTISSMIIFVVGYLVTVIPLFDYTRTRWAHVRRIINKADKIIVPRNVIGQKLYGIMKIVANLFSDFVGSKIAAMIFHSVWFGLGLSRLMNDRQNGGYLLRGGQNENEWSFGQLLAILLIVINVFSAIEIYFGTHIFIGLD